MMWVLVEDAEHCPSILSIIDWLWSVDCTKDAFSDYFEIQEKSIDNQLFL